MKVKETFKQFPQIEAEKLILREVKQGDKKAIFHSWSKESFKAQIGYELLKEYWRQGIMTEALETIILFGFESLNLNRIEALVELENATQ